MAERHPAPTRKDHERFCVTEGWAERKRATGKRGTHHVNYELTLPDGRVLFTRISHPVDRSGYGPSLWAHILGDQLLVTADEFWDCVSKGKLPERGRPEVPAEAIPIAVVRTLISQAHIPEAEVMGMTKAQALQRLTDFYLAGH